jgi:hypothetical protein
MFHDSYLSGGRTALRWLLGETAGRRWTFDGLVEQENEWLLAYWLEFLEYIYSLR